MKYGESATAQRHVHWGDLLYLRDIADQPIAITGYEQRRSRDDRTYLVLTVVRWTDPAQRTVPVATSATVVVRQVVGHFTERPAEPLEAVITKRTGRQGWGYWVILHPDQYERQRDQGGTVRYPTRQERLVRPTDVAANDDKIEHIPF
jgi:hypothetical protein